MKCNINKYPNNKNNELIINRGTGFSGLFNTYIKATKYKV